MTDFSLSTNGKGHVARDGPNGHLPFSCLEVVVASEDMTSVAEKDGRSKSSFGPGMSRALQITCMRVCRAPATWALPFAYLMARQSSLVV